MDDANKRLEFCDESVYDFAWRTPEKLHL